ncbi:hypothetical protein M431DRAFT_540824 [Trichoderma harzianum CBS 226.95]|uniref:Secreted protein n=1 Tax=Trichoderma harzianum CBS 226.95 TaxID=983964 RepID=A0A2T4A1D3_TRIHA|nr:hypothetical protein M431DRAFT_540824 [Trichoderma harzianum CBS 226.95]PTB50874.1 hypothetical protein M431DRAFT_540824 [Trichoderma harzianum CBS 226.95]
MMACVLLILTAARFVALRRQDALPVLRPRSRACPCPGALPTKLRPFDPLTSPLCGRPVSKDPAVRIGSWIDANAVRHPVYVGCTKTEYRAEHILIQTNTKHMQHVLPYLTALLLLR